MQTVYIGNTLINDVFLGSKRMDDVLQSFILPIEFLVVAAGGAGGDGSGISGGGGAGRYLASSASLFPGTYPIVVGGAVSSANGQDSTFLGITCPGGGKGGNGGSTGAAGNGSDGGSGGGGGDGASRVGGNAVAATGNYGTGNGNGGGSNRPGAGGGAGGAGTSTPGPTLTWLDGQGYCGGGNSGTNRVASIYSGSGGYGRDTGSPPSAGNNGIVKIRYIGVPRASGGTITQSGGYTYHTFQYPSGSFSY